VIDTPESDHDHDQASADLNNLGATPPAPDPAPPGEKQEHPKNNRQYAQNVMRALKAIWRRVLVSVDWIDQKGPFVTAVATVAIAVLTAFYVYYSHAQWEVMRDQVIVAQKTLIASNRPWLDLQASIVGSLTFQNGTAVLPVQVRIDNVGHSPAIRVTSMQEFIQAGAGLAATPDPWQEIKEQCREAGLQSALPSNRGVTETIFQGKPQQMQMTLLMNPQELNQEVIPGTKLPYIFPVVVWCVAYQVDFSDFEHHIGYAWTVQKRDRASGKFSAIDPKGGDIPVEQLVLYQFPFIGPLAD